MRKLGTLLFLMSLLALVGCQSSLMSVTADGTTPYTPDEEKALVIFMRPSSFGGAVQSTVYQYDGSPKFVGIVSSKNKLAYQVPPGEHLFMVMGENAGFLNTDLVAGHIYYVEIEAHFGFAKARFSLEPIPQTEFDSEDFKKDLGKCKFVTNTPASEQWFIEHRQDVVEKYDSYYPKWESKTEDKKKSLTINDGRPL